MWESSRFVTAGAIALGLAIAVPAHGQEAYYTFSSGLSPGGDGFSWPTSLSGAETFETPHGITFGLVASSGEYHVSSGFAGIGGSGRVSTGDPAMWTNSSSALHLFFDPINGVQSASFDAAQVWRWTEFGEIDFDIHSPSGLHIRVHPSGGGLLYQDALVLSESFDAGTFAAGQGSAGRVNLSAAALGFSGIREIEIQSQVLGWPYPYEFGIDNMSINGAIHPSARRTAIMLNDEAQAEAPFPKEKLRVLQVDDASPIGVVQEVAGLVTVTRPNGEQFVAAPGTPIYMNDVIETDENGSANVVFIDESNFGVSQNARLSVDKYVYDPDAESGVSNFSFLRGVFVWTSELIGRDDPEDPNDEGLGYIGIRGDATPYINWDPLNPAAEMRSASAVAVVSGAQSSASVGAVSLYTSVEVPDEPFELTFDFAFLDSSGTLEVEIDGISLLTLTGESSEVDFVYRYTLDVSDPAILELLLAELAFTYDGDPGSSMFLDNVSMPGLNNGDFSQWDNGWFSRGAGQVDLVASVVPEPAALSLLGLLAFIGRRARSSKRPMHGGKSVAR